MSENIIKIKNISKKFQKNNEEVQILNDVNLDIKKGEFITIVGKSGCGKSTLLKLISGMVPITEGEILINGKSVNGVSKDCSMIFQDARLFPWLKIKDNVAIGLKNISSEEKNRIVLEYLELVGLKGVENSYPDQLSGGMAQRASIARGLALNSQIMLFDEPFSALDEHLRQQIRHDMLQALRQSGTSAIFVTHDRDEALRYADKIAVLQNGEILQIANPRTLYWSPKHLSTATFIGESIVLPATLNSPSTAHCQLGDIAVIDKSQGQQSGTLLLRPEQFSLLKTPQNPTALFNAVVKNVEFKGKITAIRLEINGFDIELEEHHGIELCVGDRVDVYLYGTGLFYGE